MNVNLGKLAACKDSFLFSGLVMLIGFMAGLTVLGILHNYANVELNLFVVYFAIGVAACALWTPAYIRIRQISTKNSNIVLSD